MAKADFQDTSCHKDCAMCGSVFYRDKRNTWKHWGAARFCSRKCSAQEGVRKRLIKLPTAESVFWSKARKASDDECWKWDGVHDKDGYPLLSFGGKQIRATRVAVQISGVRMLADQHACHSCGNSWCCNPSHLYAGTPKQNNGDKKLHGTHLNGSRIHCAKLNERAVIEIRQSKQTNSELAKKYGVTIGAVYLARSRKTWRHVP